MLCVECGKEVPLLIGGSCPECFIQKTPLLEHPPVLDVEVCAHCDARRVGNHWVDPQEGDDLSFIREEAARAAIRVHERVTGSSLELEEQAQDERNFEHAIRLTGTVEGVPVSSVSRMTVRLKRGVCDRCSRMFGGFYAAVIQLRATGRDVTEHELQRAHRFIGGEMDRLRATGNREAFLSKSEAVPGGYDYYMGDIEGTRTVARGVAEKLGASLEEHAKLVGRKEGTDVYRVTFLVRIRRFAPGDFATVDGEDVVQFQSAARGRAFVVRLSDRGTDKLDEERLQRLGGTELLVEAVVVSHDAAHVQVLDPVTLRTVDVPRPPGLELEGATAWVLRQEDRILFPALPFTPPAAPVRRPKANKGP
jgi:nonsense-mediated mRNA decay protein 3